MLRGEFALRFAHDDDIGGGVGGSGGRGANWWVVVGMWRAGVNGSGAADRGMASARARQDDLGWI